ncbi:MAG: single-stranded DNA-binding protein [Coleofasciculus sp. S288]|nr:single-stranded DNA-binding protein [Coleofasciculus sp. S288]
MTTQTALSINSIHLVGRVGVDPDVKYFESGSVLCKLSLAVDRRSRNTEQPDWFNLELWGKVAEVAANYVRKGKLIGIRGSLEIQEWTDRNDGSDRSKPIIRVAELELLSAKNDTQLEEIDKDEFEDIPI